MRRRTSVTGGMLVLLLATSLLGGCRRDATASGSDRVNLETPVGGLQMKVKTDAEAAEGTGLPVYPGALLVKKNGKVDGDKTADIHLSLGSLQLRVEVLSYQTTDAPAEVQSFYAKALGRFGTVLTCAGARAVGTPVQTPEGLTCSSTGRGAADGSSGDGTESKLELKAGSPQHQHVVSVQADGGGTKFALIRIDLPREFTLGGEADRTRTAP